MAKYVVTGGAGFIGSHIVDALIERGDEVNILDNLSTGDRANINSKAKLFELDIRDKEGIKSVFDGAHGVFHLAALARVQPSILDPWTSNDVNVNGTLAVLLAARDAGVKRFVYSASSSAYGDNEIFPTPENTLPRPLSPYALQKHVGEYYTRLFSLLYGMQTVSLRYFNVYGPRAKTEGAYSLVIGKFISQRLKDEPMTIVGDGTNTRAYTHVSDVVKANLLAMQSSKVGKGEVVNIGGKKEYSVNEIAKMIGGLTTNIEPRIEPKRSLPDSARAKELIGWESKVELEEGLKELKNSYGLS